MRRKKETNRKVEIPKRNKEKKEKEKKKKQKIKMEKHVESRNGEKRRQMLKGNKLEKEI